MPESTNQARGPEGSPTANDIVTRWGGHESVLNGGYLAVPTVFLKHLASIGKFGLTPAEALFVLEVMVFKWDKSAPFPSYRTIAERMGVSETYVRKLARSLEQKKYLRRIKRTGTTNLFDLQPLFDLLAEQAKRTAK